MRGTCAIAVFVKTPGLSLVKTRLVKSIGKENAEHFYHLSVKATEAVVQKAIETDSQLVPYWAIAEEAAVAPGRWPGFANIFQGDGELGARLSHVYSSLLKKHSSIVFIGADSPQLSPSTLVAAASITLGNHFVVGRANDGGFYIFGGSYPLSSRVWLSVSYSQSDTAQLLCDRLILYGEVKELPRLSDIDNAVDFGTLRNDLLDHRDLLPEQINILKWLDQLGHTTSTKERV